MVFVTLSVVHNEGSKRKKKVMPYKFKKQNGGKRNSFFVNMSATRM
jgi:hypothetical protein